LSYLREPFVLLLRRGSTYADEVSRCGKWQELFDSSQIFIANLLLLIGEASRLLSAAEKKLENR
jgi:hypothetical protein